MGSTSARQAFCRNRPRKARIWTNIGDTGAIPHFVFPSAGPNLARPVREPKLRLRRGAGGTYNRPNPSSVGPNPARSPVRSSNPSLRPLLRAPYRVAPQDVPNVEAKAPSTLNLKEDKVGSSRGSATEAAKSCLQNWMPQCSPRPCLFDEGSRRARELTRRDFSEASSSRAPRPAAQHDGQYTETSHKSADA